MTALLLKDIRFAYSGQEPLLRGVTLELAEGAVAAVTGVSGCGKSTLAMIACGAIPKAVPGTLSGHVFVFGEDIADKPIYQTAQQISMVFQDPEGQLFAPSVTDEVAFAPENLCFNTEAINTSIDNALSSVGISGLRDLPPDKLSGGQQQLAALASILALDPHIIILDEVAAQVDSEGVVLLRQSVKALKARGKTVLIIEQENDFESLYDVAYLLDDGAIRKL